MNNIYPLVSVAVITYNQKEYLSECIDSILAQEYPNVQIVVADDGSSDGSQELLREYKEKYPEVFVLCLSQKNMGITYNSNLAHFTCTGKYIAWMGGDDVMLPMKLNKQVEFMENNADCTISYHNLDVFDSDTNTTLYFFNDKKSFEGDIRVVIRQGAFNGACSTMVRADKSPKYGFDEKIPVASDWLYWVDTLANGGEIMYIDLVLGRYRRHDSNVTNVNNYIAQNELDHLNSCHIMLAKYPNYFNDIYYVYARRIASLRHRVPYFQSLWLSFKMSPSFKVFGALVVYCMSFGQLKF